MRPLNLTAKLKDTANTSIPQLSFQRKAIQDYHSRPKEVPLPAGSSNDPPSLTLNAHLHLLSSADTTSTLQAKRTFSSITSNDDVEDSGAQPAQCNFFLKLRV